MGVQSDVSTNSSKGAIKYSPNALLSDYSFLRELLSTK